MNKSLSDYSADLKKEDLVNVNNYYEY
jgi:hypothetical protein